jgi:hypothetical protein
MSVLAITPGAVVNGSREPTMSANLFTARTGRDQRGMLYMRAYCAERVIMRACLAARIVRRWQVCIQFGRRRRYFRLAFV